MYQTPTSIRDFEFNFSDSISSSGGNKILEFEIDDDIKINWDNNINEENHFRASHHDFKIFSFKNEIIDETVLEIDQKEYNEEK